MLITAGAKRVNFAKGTQIICEILNNKLYPIEQIKSLKFNKPTSGEIYQVVRKRS